MKDTKKAFPLWWEGLFAGKFFARKIFCEQKENYLVPKMRSPQSPRPGTMNFSSLSFSSRAAQ